MESLSHIGADATDIGGLCSSSNSYGHRYSNYGTHADTYAVNH